MDAVMRARKPLWVRVPRRTLEIAGVVMIAGMAILTLTDVSMRTAFNDPVDGAYDVNVYWFMVGISAIGLWYAQLKREHITVTLFSDRASGAASMVLDLLIGLVSLALALALAWYGWERAVDAYQLGEYVGVYRVPTWPVRFLVVLAALAYAVSLGIMLWQRVLSREVVEDGEEDDDEF